MPHVPRPRITPIQIAAGNWGSRGAVDVDTLVLHSIQGTLAGATGRFKDPAAKASCHYGVGRGGELVQWVADPVCAYHAGNKAVNLRSVGIELGGFCDSPNFLPPAQFDALAALAAYLVDVHRIPLDRAHLIGHSEVPDPFDPKKKGGASHHTDPGPRFPWDRFMAALEAARRTAC